MSYWGVDNPVVPVQAIFVSFHYFLSLCGRALREPACTVAKVELGVADCPVPKLVDRTARLPTPPVPSCPLEAPGIPRGVPWGFCWCVECSGGVFTFVSSSQFKHRLTILEKDLVKYV